MNDVDCVIKRDEISLCSKNIRGISKQKYHGWLCMEFTLVELIIFVWCFPRYFSDIAAACSPYHAFVSRVQSKIRLHVCAD